MGAARNQLLVTITALALGGLIASKGCGATVVSGDTLIWRMTSRDFLPAGCFQNYTELADLWDYSKFDEGRPYGFQPNTPNAAQPYINASDSSAERYRGNDSEYCPIWNDIFDGKYNGHPDFEAPRQVTGNGCYRFLPLTSQENGGFSCATTSGAEIPTLPNATQITEHYLEIDESGLPKPVYCKNPYYGYIGDMRCGTRLSADPVADGFNVHSTVGQAYFDLWYRDSKRYNLRVGFPLNLTYNATKGTYRFSSQSSTPPRFHPLNQFAGVKPCLATDMRLDCRNGGKIFPWSKLGSTAGNEHLANTSFLFTTEAHFFFNFEGNETFVFTGDDDFWIFINGKLAVDVGGLHVAASSKIDLSAPAVQQALDIQVGGIYSVDLFHAERKTSGSNFVVETTFRARCNVVQAGRFAYEFNTSNFDQDWKLIGGPGWGILDSGTILLTRAEEANSVGYAFLRQQINMGTGFVADFTFTASSQTKGEGFVFIIQRDSIINRNGGSGGNLGFRNTLDSVGIVFDFCADRLTSPNCDLKQVRMHVGANNNASDATKSLSSSLLFPNDPQDDQVHRVTIRYFSVPAWFEVIIDNDLFLQKRDFDLSQSLGGRNAYVGFAGSTGMTTGSTVRISDLKVKTVAVKNGNAKLVVNASSIVVADGRQRFTAQIVTYDFCEKRIQFGGLKYRAGAILIDSTNPLNRIPLQVVEDADDGTYSLQFVSQTNGTFDLVAWFGDTSCTEQSTGVSESCFVSSVPTAVQFIPAPPSTTQESTVVLSLAQLLLGLGLTAGLAFILGTCAALYVLPARRQWLRDKKFIEKGRLAVLEKGVVYESDFQIEVTTQRLQRVLEALQQARANQLVQLEYEELLETQGKLEEEIRLLKKERAALARQASSLRLRPRSLLPSLSGSRRNMSGENLDV